MQDDARQLARKNFELARALAGAQRQIAWREQELDEERQRHRAWVLKAHQDLDYLASVLIEAREAWLGRSADS